MVLQTKHLLIKGKVQGVFYRKNTLKQAEITGLKGYVKNLPNGNVEIVATGTNEQLNKLISWCKKGPNGAQVSAVEEKNIDLTNFEKFRIL